MQDSNLVYRFSSVGEGQVVSSADRITAALGRTATAASGIASPSQSAASATDKLATSQDKNAKATNRAAAAHENYFVHIAKTTIQSALVNKAFLGLADAAGQAIKQTDLIAQFPAQMQALGLSAKDATVALGGLRTYVQGVGGDLSKAVSTVTRFSGVTKNVKAAVAEYAGLNNALIAGGGSADVQASALEQLTQAYSRGRPQAIEFKSALVAMQPQLAIVAKAMNFSSANALGEALTTGKVSMQAFMTELTKLSTGTGPIAKQVAVQMTGIGFATNQMKAALVNGLTLIYETVGRNNIVSFFQFLTQVIGVLAKYIVVLINDFISLFNIISKVFNGPQIAHFSGEAAGAAAALGDGAGNAGDMADGLGDAADNAAKINKSLASFDKMNVLPDKTSGDTKAAPQNGLDPADTAALESAFGDITNKLKAASEAAKIFAGILLGLAANALIAKMFGVNPLKELISGLKNAASQATGFSKAMKDNDGNAFKAGQQVGQNTRAGIEKGLGKLGSLVAGAVGGLAGLLVETIAPAIGGAFVAIGSAIAGVFVGLAAIVGLPVEIVVAIVVLAVAAIVAAVWLIWTNWQTIWGFIKQVFDDVVGAIVAVWNTLFAIFAAPIEWVLGFIRGVVILIVALFLWLVLGIAKLWLDMVTGIYNLLAGVASWIYDNVITPVLNLFIGLWTGVVNAVVTAWQWIYANVLAPIGGWINANVIQPVIGFFSGLWHSISGFFSNIFHDITGILSPLGSWISVNIINPIAGFFKGLWDGVKNGVSDMIAGVKNILGSLGDIVKAPINLVIDGWNKIIGSINKIHIPGTSVGPNFQPLPRLARGGVVDQATMAIIGENGSEAVMPLENNTEWIDTLASKLNERAGDGQPVQLVVQIGEDKVASKLIDLINEKTNMSGRNVIYV